jgi:hypothetical protein
VPGDAIVQWLFLLSFYTTPYILGGDDATPTKAHDHHNALMIMSFLDPPERAGILFDV